MNRIQLLIFNQQCYLKLIDNKTTVNQLFDNQQNLVEFTKNEFEIIDSKNEITANSKLISISKKFEEYQEIDKKVYEYLEKNYEKIIDNFENNLLSKATSRRLPMLLKSLFVVYCVQLNFTKSEQKNLLINEIVEISKLYLEPKFVKMLNKVIDDFGN